MEIRQHPTVQQFYAIHPQGETRDIGLTSSTEEEEQIDPILLCAPSQSLMTSNESKIIAQLCQELLQLTDERVFQF